MDSTLSVTAAAPARPRGRRVRANETGRRCSHHGRKMARQASCDASMTGPRTATSVSSVPAVGFSARKIRVRANDPTTATASWAAITAPKPPSAAASQPAAAAAGERGVSEGRGGTAPGCRGAPVTAPGYGAAATGAGYPGAAPGYAGAAGACAGGSGAGYGPAAAPDGTARTAGTPSSNPGPAIAAAAGADPIAEGAACPKGDAAGAPAITGGAACSGAASPAPGNRSTCARSRGGYTCSVRMTVVAVSSPSTGSAHTASGSSSPHVPGSPEGSDRPGDASDGPRARPNSSSSGSGQPSSGRRRGAR